ncbi:MAG: cation diffusion facilitator family transporter [Candidatus Gracilibacteria bacterium]|nr:cation diffusion facilitator family transporter [Candidatus Gracilibacteria bacterium]
MSLQRTATIASSTTAFLLLIIKFIVGIMSGSIAVLSSAIDSTLDLFVSLFNYFAIHSSEKDADTKFNYGRGKIEALAALFEGLVITGSGFYIFYEAVLKIINKETVSYLGVSVGIMIVSVILTGALVYFLEYVAKKTNNLVIKSDALHYKTDLYSNAGILLGLAIIYFTGLYFIDGIIGIIIAIYIIYSAWELISKGYHLLLDAALDENEIQQIISIIKSQNMVNAFHELKTRQIGNVKYVEVHLVFNPKILLIDAHRIGDHIEYSIPKIDPLCEWKVLVHLDPYDDSPQDSINFDK